LRVPYRLSEVLILILPVNPTLSLSYRPTPLTVILLIWYIYGGTFIRIYDRVTYSLLGWHCRFFPRRVSNSSPYPLSYSISLHINSMAPTLWYVRQGISTLSQSEPPGCLVDWNRDSGCAYIVKYIAT
jgi:hypothetical protein